MDARRSGRSRSCRRAPRRAAAGPGRARAVSAGSTHSRVVACVVSGSAAGLADRQGSRTRSVHGEAARRRANAGDSGGRLLLAQRLFLVGGGWLVVGGCRGGPSGPPSPTPGGSEDPPLLLRNRVEIDRSL